VGAELARITGDFSQAEVLYDEAVAGALKNKFTPDAALANQRAALFYLGQGRTDRAAKYLRAARACYLQWGAHGVVSRLEQSYSGLLGTDDSSRSLPRGDSTGLNQTTLFKAVQALSGEIHLDALVNKLLVATMENTGATRCGLIMSSETPGGSPLVKAIVDTTPGGPQTAVESQHLDACAELPRDIVYYAMRTSRHVIIDAENDHTLHFHKDEYIQRVAPKSALCCPIEHQGNTVGVLYAENRFAYEAFTEGHLDLVRILATQAAISIENALLFQQKQEFADELLSERQFINAALDALTDTFFAFDPATGRPRIWNSAFSRISGYSDAEILELKAPDAYYGPEDLKVASKTIEAVLAGKHATCALSLITRDGSLVPTEYSASAVRDEAGMTKYIIAIGRDITERQKAERALRTSEAQYRALVEGFGGIAFRTSIDFSPLFFHGAVEQITGYSQDELVRDLRSWDLVVHPDDASTFREQTNNTLKCPTQPWSCEYRIVRKDGTSRWVRQHASLELDRTGNPCFVNGIVADITDQKSVEQQLLQAQKMEALGTLAGGVAHDMNNILMGVLGTASLMEATKKEDDPDLQDIRQIVSAAERGKALVHDILGFSRKEGFTKAHVQLNEIILDLTKMLRRSMGKMVAIHTSLDSHVSSVEADSAHIAQALMNICLNACDAIGEQGTITVSTGTEELAEGSVTGLPGGRYTKVQVGDDGRGMSEETRTRAIEPFYTTKDVGKGTGLGLAMAYRVVTSHGGSLSIDSKLGVGTTVTVLLPAAERPNANEDEEEPSNPRGIEPCVPKKQCRLLFVDDEELLRNVGKLMLESLGHDVLLADGGASALELYRTSGQDIDLVLLDLSMPDMDGAECFRHLKALDPLVPVVICTGHGKRIDIDAMVREGALGTLRKPFGMDELSAALGQCLQRRCSRK
jgi:PAS domain S-box-containing protein